MAQPDPDSREFRQMRHDVDDVYALLDSTAQSIVTVSTTQRRHGNRLEEIQQSLDLQNGRLDRLEDTQRKQGDRLARMEDTQQQQGERLEEILALLRGSAT